MPILMATNQPVPLPSALSAPIPGDYNNDSLVNAADYNVWKSEFGSTTHLAADGNGNGIVDSADYVVWRNLLAGGSGIGSSAGGAVPEPSVAGLVLLAMYTAAAAFPRRLRRAA
jgi:hypothetical protein